MNFATKKNNILAVDLSLRKFLLNHLLKATCYTVKDSGGLVIPDFN